MEAQIAFDMSQNELDISEKEENNESTEDEEMDQSPEEYEDWDIVDTQELINFDVINLTNENYEALSCVVDNNIKNIKNEKILALLDSGALHYSKIFNKYLK